MASHLEPDDSDVVFAAFNSNELKMSGCLGQLFGSDERSVTDRNDAIRTAALEKSMGEKNRFLDPSRPVGRSESGCEFAQPALIGAKGQQQPGLGGCADHHHFLP